MRGRDGQPEEGEDGNASPISASEDESELNETSAKTITEGGGGATLTMPIAEDDILEDMRMLNVPESELRTLIELAIPDGHYKTGEDLPNRWFNMLPLAQRAAVDKCHPGCWQCFCCLRHFHAGQGNNEYSFFKHLETKKGQDGYPTTQQYEMYLLQWQNGPERKDKFWWESKKYAITQNPATELRAHWMCGTLGANVRKPGGTTKSIPTAPATAPAKTTASLGNRFRRGFV